jgi:proliferating cell nuclear antigen PCNA
MKIHIEDSSRFATVLAVCKEFHEYITFDIHNNSLKATILDSTHVSVTILEISVIVEDIERSTINIRTDDIAKTVSLAQGGSVIMEPREDRLLITLNDSKVQAHLRLFDVDVEDMSIDGYEPECICTLASQTFFGVVKDLSTFGDTVSMNTNKESNTLRISTTGDVGTFHIDVPASIQGDMPPVLSFAMRYINSLSKASKLCSDVRLSLGDNMPMRVCIESDDITITFFLAPKIEDDM